MKPEAVPFRTPAGRLFKSFDPEEDEFVGNSDAFRYMRFRLQRVAATDATVLLLGETGTGKGVAAREVHRLSARRHARFMSVDCTSLPPTLIESELFGRERGAFTDARAAQAGRFELAHGGTVFLDEIGEFPLDAQAKLLRILQSGQFERLGSPHTVQIDVRIIAATNKDLAAEVRNGRFRGDLYFRLNVFPVTLPPLRDRRNDIPLLSDYLLKRLAQKHGRTIASIPRAVIDSFIAYDWPGNVRELENVLERAIITSPDETLRLSEPLVREHGDALPVAAMTLLVDVERAHILRILQTCGWRIEGPHGAAVMLGLKPSTLRSRMQKLGIRRSQTGATFPPHVA